ncbi:MAG: Maf family nucleotide pyrophosphatase [Kangiellaceae bacterium]|nr:Maf family nucleotide pyrophosphatase [Kangiellaceae bacterium]MCW9016949.1 Maf family nucleotide pyrophosphatase [Kangiellaceae bacterium]
MIEIILASSSKYRRQLLGRICNKFKQLSPNVDESILNNEQPLDYVKRLSTNKANVIARKHPKALVIGSDQCAIFNNQILGKPGTREQAISQLSSFSGQQVTFLTGVCLAEYHTSSSHYFVDTTSVHFKKLTLEKIEEYIEIDCPLDCAGSFKVESCGVFLFDKVVSDDPTALQGLPLIGLAKLFEHLNLDLSDLMNQ